VSEKQLGKEMVAEKKEFKKVHPKLTPPPAPPVKLGDAENPIVGNRGLKRALVIAIAKACTNKENQIDLDKAAILIRASGIIYKSGWTQDKPTDELTTSEWSGRPYAKFAVSAFGKVYEGKFPEKVEKCSKFARALLHAYREERQREKEESKQHEVTTIAS